MSGEVVYSNPAAAVLLEYSLLKTRNGNPLAPKLTDFIRNHADEIDYGQAFRDIFYGVEYPDYLFSLPMGAGKTFLMAAFIYLDLYFADNEPDNPAFAHNFIVLVPSGLKSSIVPSLKHIQDFDPSWIMPEKTANEFRALIGKIPHLGIFIDEVLNLYTLFVRQGQQPTGKPGHYPEPGAALSDCSRRKSLIPAAVSG